MIRPFLFAWHFLTAIPLCRRHHDPAGDELARSMRWYAVVGFLLGGALVGTDALLAFVVARPVVDGLLILLLVLLTRALHQDGLADTLDGFAGGHSPEERLAIMRDGRIGAMGATGLVLALGLRYLGIAGLPGAERLAVLFAMPALGRWAMAVGAVSAPYARKEGGLGEPFLARLSWRDPVWAAVPLVLVLPWALGPIGAAVSMGLAAAVAIGFARLSTRLCGGVTGDTLGATNEIAEVAFLLIIPVVLSLR